MIFKDRIDAGKQLAAALEKFRDEDTIVLGLTRGGIPVAFEVAKKLNVPLDAICVRKLGVPYFPELGMGAIAPGVELLNEDLINRLNIQEVDLNHVRDIEIKELKRQMIAYRGDDTLPSVKGKTVMIIDDGLATGGSMKAAIKSVKKAGAAKVIVGVPVGPPETVTEIREEVDHLICLYQPWDFNAVGAYYYIFSQTPDEEVIELLNESKSSA